MLGLEIQKLTIIKAEDAVSAEVMHVGRSWRNRPSWYGHVRMSAYENLGGLQNLQRLVSLRRPKLEPIPGHP